MAPDDTPSLYANDTAVHRRPKVVGLTGGMAAGKSLVADMFKAMGVLVWDADEAAKNLYRTNPGLREAILARWGDDLGVNDELGEVVDLNRAKIAQIVFGNSEELTWLESLVHPAVGRAFEDWLRAARGSNSNGFVMREAAILFESGAAKSCDLVLTVEAPKSLRLERAIRRASNTEFPLSEEDILSRMNNQWDSSKRTALADIVIDNGPNSRLLPQILEVLKDLRNRFG
jgi:dephospho-CoA kinase